jgi:hypothetical protein
MIAGGKRRSLGLVPAKFSFLLGTVTKSVIMGRR